MALTGYLIVSADSRDALETAVLDKAAEGYIPYGASYSVERKFLQTMVIGDVAGGGGSSGGGSIATLTDVFYGDLQPPGAGDFLFAYAMDGDNPKWTNYNLSSVVEGLITAFTPAAITTYLEGLPGYAAGFRLAVNGTLDGFEWVAPPPAP